MSEEIMMQEEPLSEVQEAQAVENIIPADTTEKDKEAVDILTTDKPKLSKKKVAILAVAAVVIIAIAIVLLIPSKFERVQNECVHIAGMITGSGDYFMIDTYPDDYENMDEMMQALLVPSAQENALKAIKYANEELGFNGSVYSQMMETTALMGRQHEENAKYEVSWTYHPDDGLEVTYEKK